MTDPATTEVLLAWMPGKQRVWSLQDEVPTLAAALLYGDTVKVLCPQSDDALETADYFDLARSALSRCVTFQALDSRYALMNDQGELIERDGSLTYVPLVPEVSAQFVQEVSAQVGAAIARGYLEDVAKGVRKLLTAVNAHEDRPRLLEHAGVGPVLLSQIEAAVHAADDAAHEATSELLGATFLHASMQEGRLPMLNDDGNALRGLLPETVASSRKSFEAMLANSMLAQLPSPATIPWDELADVRRGLERPLVRFRRAIARLARTNMNGNERERLQQVWREEVAPALAELEELVREASWRKVFFDTVSGDLKLYAGPLSAIAAASLTDVSSAVAAVTGVGAPLLKLAVVKKERQRAAESHEFFYLQEVGRRLRKQTWGT